PCPTSVSARGVERWRGLLAVPAPLFFAGRDGGADLGAGGAAQDTSCHSRRLVHDGQTDHTAGDGASFGAGVFGAHARPAVHTGPHDRPFDVVLCAVEAVHDGSPPVFL